MSFEDNVYRYLGLGVVILIAMYVLIKSLTFQGKILEGLTNSPTETTEISLLNTIASKSTENISGQNDKLQDILAVEKYRTDYENLIISLEEYTNIMMFSKVLGIGSKVAGLSKGQAVTDDILSEVDKANKLKMFIDTLNSSMTFIDKSKKTPSKLW
ncbi:MAG: hypothetical protein WD512_13515 [Candidatus Paceibacterota bacterium]